MKTPNEPDVTDSPEAMPALGAVSLLEALAIELRAEQNAQNKTARLLYMSMANGKKHSDKADPCGMFANILERTLKSASNADISDRL